MARTDDSNIMDMLSTTHDNQLEENCINYALIAAVVYGKHSNVRRLILHGASNIDKALEESRRLQRHFLTARLLIIKAAIEDDHILVLKLYGEDVQGLPTKIPLIEEDDLAKLQHCVHDMKVMVPIRISQGSGALAVRDELLFRTGIDKKNGTVLWSNLYLIQLEISWLQKIYWVKNLLLSGNEFTILPPEMGIYLKQCTKLNLQRNSIREIPSCLLELPNIIELNLSHNSIAVIPDVPELSASLSALNLSHNCLSSLPDSIVAPFVENLNISHNQFCTVPLCVCSFTGLTTLNIAYNSGIRALPSELSRLKYLVSITLNGLNSLKFPNKNERITTNHFLSKQLQTKCEYYHMKLIILGKNGTGKSTLAARLSGKKVNDKPTHSLDIIKWKYTPSINKKTFHFTIWDFMGRQKCCQYFFSELSLYLLLWNITEGNTGILELESWLNLISLKVPDACVIVVGTFLDKISKEDHQSGKIDNVLKRVQELAAQYEHLTISNISVVGLHGNMENLPQLKNYIYEAASRYKINNQHVMGAMIPSSYHTLVSKLTTIHHKVKEGEHEPIMHAVEFKKMVRDLNLVDIQDDEDLRNVTQFLHEDGALLHYDDWRNNLDDLYFVDPQWLCDVLFTFVTVNEGNNHMKHGVLRSKSITHYFEDKRISQYFQQILTLLNRFEIALPLDKDHKRIFFPSMLPQNRPAIVSQHLPDVKDCFRRYIVIRPSVYTSDSFQHLNHPGVWSRLFSHIMNKIKEVRSILNEQIPGEENDHICLDKRKHASFRFTSEDLSKSPVQNNTRFNIKSASLSQSSNAPEEYLHYNKPVATSGSQQLEDQQSSANVFSVKDNRSLVLWKSGLFYNVDKNFFIIESSAESIKQKDKNGILIMCSQTAVGQKVLCDLVDIVELLISEWYPEMSWELESNIPCPKCVKAGCADPYEFKVLQLKVSLVVDHKFITKCGASHQVKLSDLVPDLLLADLDPVFHLDSNKVIYKEERKALLGYGAFGEIYHGKYKDQSVAVKLYKVSTGLEILKELRSESKVLQKLHHPCLVSMIGVTIHPEMSLVLEKAPLGTLLNPLLMQQKVLSRIVLYRIAVQVASALHFLHSINIIHCNLEASNILFWSLSPDHLINCKVTSFDLSTHSDPGGSRGLQSTKGFIAPEISHSSCTKEPPVYDHRIDIFSFGMFLYQLITHRHPFHNVQQLKVKAFIEEHWRPQLEDIPLSKIGLFYMTQIMKLCWAGKAMERPTTWEIIKWFSSPTLQLILSVIPINSKYSISDGCFVSLDLSSEVDTSSEIWVCCDASSGFELNIYKTNTMQKVADKLVNKHQVCCIKQCGEHVWLPSLETGVVNIFNRNSKDLIHTIHIEGDVISCITNSDQLVYMGTVEGYCYACPIDIHTITPCYRHVSDHCVDGVVVTVTYLWASAHNQIYFLDSESLELKSFQKRPKNTEALVGKMMLSDNEDQVWSAHLGGVIMSLWDAHQRVHLCDVDVDVIAEEKCHVGDPRDQIITAMCTGLDTVWIGLASGHIIVFGMNPPGEVLTYFRPYHSYVRFLSAINYPGPCEKEKCMMLSGGKMYQPDDSFKELPDYPRKDRRGQPVDTAGVAILWEVIPSKYVCQLHYLRDGEAWSSYDSLQKAMIDTGFTESLKYFHTPGNSSTAAVPHNDTPVNGTTDHQQVVKVQNIDTLHGDATISTTVIHNDVTSQSKQLSINLPSGEQLTLTCEQPITINSLGNKIAMVAEMKGDILITYKVDGKDIVTIKSDEQLEEYLCLSNRPNICVKLV